jgi:hypothetical protein
MQKITYGEDTYDVNAVILVRDRDAQLARMFRKEVGAADTVQIPLNSQENVSEFQNRMQDGYELLCLILSDGRTKYTVNPEHLDVAEKLALTVNRRVLLEDADPEILN